MPKCEDVNSISQYINSFRVAHCSCLLADFSGPGGTQKIKLSNEKLSQRGEPIAVPYCLAYIAESNELLFFNAPIKDLRSLQMPGGDSLREEFKPTGAVWSVCFVPEESTLLLREARALVALQLQRKANNEWRQPCRLETEFTPEHVHLCAVNNARVLCGKRSNCLSLYRVESGGRIALVENVRVDVEFITFAATTRGFDSLVAIRTEKLVILHQLVGIRLFKLSQSILSSSIFSSDRLNWINRTLHAPLSNEKDQSSAQHTQWWRWK